VNSATEFHQDYFQMNVMSTTQEAGSSLLSNIIWCVHLSVVSQFV